MRDTSRHDRGTDRDLPGEPGRSDVPDPSEDDIERTLAALYGDDDVDGDPRPSGRTRGSRSRARSAGVSP